MYKTTVQPSGKYKKLVSIQSNSDEQLFRKIGCYQLYRGTATKKVKIISLREEGKIMKHIVSFSGGKDSTAMLLRMIELDMPINEILFCDTGVEFPQMYEHIDKVEQYIGRKITRLKAEHDFLYFMFDYVPKYHRSKKENLHEKGLSWPSSHIRWCTRRLKANVIDKYLKKLSDKYELVQYVGIAADEPKRIKDLNYPPCRLGLD